MKKLVLAILLAYMAATAGDVTFWVPPYGIKTCKKTVDSTDFGGLGMKDAITALALQFWVPDTDRVVFQPKYAGSGSNEVNADNVAWFVDWGKRHNVPVLLCIYNSLRRSDGTELWDWEAVHEAMLPENRTKFVKSVVDTMDKYRLDGVDIDFEGSGAHDNIAKADSALYLAFSKELADSVHARDGKVVKAAVFGYKYHYPSWNWWWELLKVYDGIETMGYKSSTAPVANSTSEYGYYSTRIKHVREKTDVRYVDRLMLGLPSDVDEWLGTTADENLAWFNETAIDDSSARLTDTTSVGICVWDAQLKGSAWKTESVWRKIAQISADVRAKRNAAFDSSCTRTAIPGKFTARFLKSYLSGSQPDNYASQGGSGILQPGDRIVLKGHSCSEAMTVADPSASNYLVHLTGDWMRTEAIRLEFEKVVFPAPDTSSAVAKDFALPGFRAAATVYGITGRALLTLPEGEWSSAEQVRDAVRGRLPSGVYLVRFDGVPQTMKLGIRD